MLSELPFTFAFLTVLYVLLPFLVLIHEMGHAVPGIRAGKRPTVIVGTGPPMIDHSFRTFDLRFSMRLGWSRFRRRPSEDDAPLGECEMGYIGLTVGQVRSIHGGGPHLSIVAGVCLLGLAVLLPVGSYLFYVTVLSAVWSAGEGLANLVPFKTASGFQSDGSRLARLRGLDADRVLLRRIATPSEPGRSDTG
jgi:hypothetical protein